jgi:hypothetical protein
LKTGRSIRAFGPRSLAGYDYIQCAEQPHIFKETAMATRPPKFTPSNYEMLPPEARMVGDNQRPWMARALLGWAATPLGPAAVYDADAIIDKYAAEADRDCAASRRTADPVHGECRNLRPDERRASHREMVEESFWFNDAGAWIGPATPIFIPGYCVEHDAPAASCPCPLSELDHWWDSRVAEVGRRARGTG